MNFDTSTHLYGVIGNPVKHSASPRLFNTIFRSQRYNGVYLAFQDASVEKLIAAMRTLSIAGYSVTIPFKEEVMGFVDDWDESARRLGCLNTVWNDHGRLIGYNFDGQGALAGLEEFTHHHPERDWRKADIVFLGNGGAARGILLTLITEKGFQGRITVVARNLAKSEKLISDAHTLNPEPEIASEPWSILGDYGVKPGRNTVVINTTSIGMSPQIEASPVTAGFWTPDMIAYDIVYNPLQTRFLREAEQAGAGTITGLHMFLGQARLQLKTWTGIELSLSQMMDFFHEARNP